MRYDERVREWLALFKYRGDERLATPLAALLTYAFRRLDLELNSRTLSARKWDAVIPVPVSEERLLDRGFNQAELLARELCGQMKLPYAELFIRTRDSEKKSLQSRLARLQSVEGLFAIDPTALERFFPISSNGATAIPAPEGPVSSHSYPHHASTGLLRLLIVDDIYTTGSTVNACAQVLHEALRQYAPHVQIHVYAITVARSG
ncbi:ComF family protein [Paenibacillus sp. MMS18-CY102]|uniref:ComF family protein n=1 Tax=Paenibacillus sp. MMS18-CY102 TaxID=2682849 RepID=UPI0013A879A5|nr:hypothetical protein [Paenibacillus sp. MMS18-CY102]MWC30924.1 hypothetical protein [Paenibacillus sp. MMS18-CY102]